LEKNMPFDDFALSFALSNVDKLESMKDVTSHPPRW
jgi:hypothetical protein